MIPAGVHLLLRLSLLLVLLAAGIQLISTQLLLPWVISGPSMAPVLLDGDVVLVDRWTYQHRNPRIGEIVLLQDPALSRDALVKRVSRFPGETGRSVWLLGDNADASLDSRTFGAVSPERLSGRVFYRYWPLNRAGWVQPIHQRN